MRPGHIVGDPFALATISIAYVRPFHHEVCRDERTLLTETSTTAGVVDSLCLIINSRHPIRFPQLRLVGYRLHAVLHYWDFDRNGIGLGADIPSLRMHASKPLAFQANAHRLLASLPQGWCLRVQWSMHWSIQKMVQKKLLLQATYCFLWWP